MRSLIFLTLSMISFTMPFIKEKTEVNKGDFKGWDKTFEGKKITELPLSENEKYFLKDFPGYVSKFTDGEREIIMRYITEGTRKLHPSSDCFKGTGYKINFKPVEIDKASNLKWNSFTALKNNQTLKIKERIFSQNESWTDVSSWYWSTLLNKSKGPWTAITVIEKTQ